MGLMVQCECKMQESEGKMEHCADTMEQCDDTLVPQTIPAGGSLNVPEAGSWKEGTEFGKCQSEMTPKNSFESAAFY